MPSLQPFADPNYPGHGRHAFVLPCPLYVEDVVLAADTLLRVPVFPS